MSDPDALLADLWAADEPPEHDHAFVIAAMERVERRRFQVNLVLLAVAVAIIGVVAWAVAPVLAVVARALVPGDGAVAATLCAAGVMSFFLWSWASDRLQPLEA